MRLGVSGRVRPDSGIGVIQRMVYPRLSERFDVKESASRDVTGWGRLSPFLGVMRGLSPVSREVDAYFCLVSPVPARVPGRFVAVVHDLRWLRDASGLKRRYRRWDLNRLLDHADWVLCVSESTRREVLRHRPDVSTKVEVALLGPGLVPDDAPFARGVPGRALLIGPASHKRNELAAEVLTRMGDRISSVAGVNVSEEAARRLEASFGASFTRLGRVSDQQLLTEYQDAAYYVHLGTEEGFGLPYVEALHCGAQVVAMDTPLTREVLDEGAILLQGEDAEDLAQSWSRQPDVAGEIRRSVAKRYSWETFTHSVAKRCSPGVGTEGPVP